MGAFTAIRKQRNMQARHGILLMLFFFSAVSFSERSILSIAGAPIASDLRIDEVTMGFLFSAFSWAYVIGQVPGGLILDRFGSGKVYGTVIFLWTAIIGLHALAGFLAPVAALMSLFVLRVLCGLITAPVFPANARIVGEWFPPEERGRASSIFSSAQYFAVVLFGPVIGWIAQDLGWTTVFFVFGIIGAVCAALWVNLYREPEGRSERKNESDHQAIKSEMRQAKMRWKDRPIIRLLTTRMTLGIYIGQYCVTGITYFFMTWFPVYLVSEKGLSVLEVGLVSTIPALAAFFGQLGGGRFSDSLVEKGISVSKARKIPIIIGMLCSMTIIFANLAESTVLLVAIMSFAFFGRGFGGMGWAIVAETSNPKIAGLNGGLFNMFGNTAGIITPVVIGILVQWTGSFELALLYVGIHAALAILCYVFFVGEIKQIPMDQGAIT
ncbi:D-glucarate permease [Bhargavaea cecembensis DSE10]|uniref:D-glucarate permease n=1 Tax=Bhargavaea cecembensis DSE10 TaxID=1235279 RepID=M7P913_9BACL|nr:MFS transporter [Bhargavaea cecembensis]EMR06994.1 D-glucarate permease [Bhargavaea cecembensis DSE10]